MDAHDVVQRIREVLGERLRRVDVRSERRVNIDIAAGDLLDASRALYERLGARFQIASGVDRPEAMEVLYHWAFDGLGLVVTVRTQVDRDAPVLDSIATLCPAAEWIEREMWELLGIDFQGHPDLRHLLLDDDWPQGKYPLRWDYER